jgi:hypothetical protein
LGKIFRGTYEKETPAIISDNGEASGSSWQAEIQSEIPAAGARNVQPS